MVGAEPGHSVLDLCASPGGKSLMLASVLFSGETRVPGSRLVCNEMSRPRAQRLQRNLNLFLPPEYVAPGGPVVVLNVDAASGDRGAPPAHLHRVGPFDRVLVDAPCTSDRHLLHQSDKSSLAHWASGAVKSNAERQLELLRSAAGLVKKGGLIVYCTCALAEQENDGVVAKFLKKAGEAFCLEPLTDAEGVTLKPSGLGVALPQGADLTACGALILPDRTPYGPMYIARIRRT